MSGGWFEITRTHKNLFSNIGNEIPNSQAQVPKPSFDTRLLLLLFSFEDHSPSQTTFDWETRNRSPRTKAARRTKTAWKGDVDM
jgi:hypothetical protein